MRYRIFTTLGQELPRDWHRELVRRAEAIERDAHEITAANADSDVCVETLDLIARADALLSSPNLDRDAITEIRGLVAGQILIWWFGG